MKYRLAIVGGGPAGYSAALEGVRLGLSVVLFERRELGGTCLNRGCVPTKFLAHAAESYHAALSGAAYGLWAEARLDYAAACRREAEIVAELRTGLETAMRQKAIEIVFGTAEIADAHRVVCNGTVYEADACLLATGSRPAEPIASGAITTDLLLARTELPASLRILGGGVIAAEFAHIFNRLGTAVTIVIRGERILRKWDREISLALTQNFKRRGIEILTRCDAERLREGTAEVVLSATGRIPETGGVAESLVERDEAGGVRVTEQLRTKTPNLFAAGDVVSGSPMLAHTAMEQGKSVARLLAGIKTEPSAVVECIYTDPEVASVGLTEARARECGIDAVSVRQPMHANARTLIAGGERGWIKLVAERASGRLLGAQLVCKRACDLVDELALSINHGFTADDLRRAARPHPSFCEAIGEAAECLADKLYAR